MALSVGSARSAYSAAAVQNAPAAAPPVKALADANARDALLKAIVFHREAADIAFKFRADVYNADLDKRQSYQGKLLLKDSTRFRLEIPGGTYVSDGKVFWEYHPKHAQVVIRVAKDSEDQPLPGDVLLRFLDSDPLSVSQVKDGGKPCVELLLDPSRAMKNLDSLAVLLDIRDYSLHRISSRDVSGNEAVYTLLSVKRNGGIKNEEFVFDPPPGTEVVDMR